MNSRVRDEESRQPVSVQPVLRGISAGHTLLHGTHTHTLSPITYVVNGVSLNSQHPLKEVSQLVLRRVSIDVPLHLLNHLLPKLVLREKKQSTDITACSRLDSTHSIALWFTTQTAAWLL